MVIRSPGMRWWSLVGWRNWTALQKMCTAARGPNGVYCLWEGRNCSYTYCPRRVFEEEIIDPSKVAPEPARLKTRMKVLEAKNQEQQTLIEALRKEVNTLKSG